MVAFCSKDDLNQIESCYNFVLFDEFNLSKNAEDFVAGVFYIFDYDFSKACVAISDLKLCIGPSILQNCFNVNDFQRISFTNNSKSAQLYILSYLNANFECRDGLKMVNSRTCEYSVSNSCKNIKETDCGTAKQSINCFSDAATKTCGKALLTDDTKVGFIIMDGSGALFGTLQGSVREVIHKFTVDLPNKNGRGGQSALRFARIRLEKRHNYVRKVAETAAELFILKDKITVTSLILAGSADFKNVLAQSEMFDPRLKAKIVKIVDIGYGDVQGLNAAIDLSEDALRNVKSLQEKVLIEKFFEEIAQDSGLFVYGLEDTLKALEMGAVQTLICWENLDDGGLKIQNVNGNLTPLKNPGTGDEGNEKFPLLDFLANNYTSFGTNLEIVTDRTREGAQFVKGFGGIGGILRYKVDFQLFETTEDEDDFDLDEY